MAKKVTTREEFVAGLKKAAEEVETKAAATKATTKATATKKVEETKKKASTATKKAATTTKKAATKATKTARATASKAKATVEKATSTVKSTAIVQFEGEDRKVDDVITRAIADFHSKSKNNLKEIKVYIKPEDKSAYYVANGNYADRIDL
ncbi:MAG: DUF6465 family protein [Lachnospiraceae bacterium]|nr:DUF6465 family protein [Lachnospiraceae bacterium]